MKFDWSDIIANWEEMRRMPTKPDDIKKVREDFVFDEDKSVKWNRQEAEKHNIRYSLAVKELNTAKNLRRDEILEDIYSLIKINVGCTKEQAKYIWNYAYAEKHPSGIYAVRDYVEELVTFLESFKNTGRRPFTQNVD